MGQYGIEPHLDAGQGSAVLVKVVQGIVVAHDDGKGEVAGNGRKGAADAGSHPARTGCEQVFDVLEGGESHAHADGVYDAVHAFVKVPALAQEEPQQEEFGGLFRDGGAEESRAEGVAQSGDAFREKTHAHGREGDGKGGEHGAPSVEEGLHQVLAGFPLQFILRVGIINKDEGGQYRQGYHVYHGLVFSAKIRKKPLSL